MFNIIAPHDDKAPLVVEDEYIDDPKAGLPRSAVAGRPQLGAKSKARNGRHKNDGGGEGGGQNSGNEAFVRQDGFVKARHGATKPETPLSVQSYRMSIK